MKAIFARCHRHSDRTTSTPRNEAQPQPTRQPRLLAQTRTYAPTPTERKQQLRHTREIHVKEAMWLNITTGHCRSDTKNVNRKQRFAKTAKWRRRDGKAQNSAWRCADPLHNTTATFNECPRPSIQHTRRQHTETQQKTRSQSRWFSKNTRSLTSDNRIHELILWFNELKNSHRNFVAINETWRTQKENFWRTKEDTCGRRR